MVPFPAPAQEVEVLLTVPVMAGPIVTVTGRAADTQPDASVITILWLPAATLVKILFACGVPPSRL